MNMRTPQQNEAHEFVEFSAHPYNVHFTEQFSR